MTGAIVAPPAWIAPPPASAAELQRHAAWVVRVLNDLARQGMPPGERIQVLALAIAADIAAAPDAEYEAVLEWVWVVVARAADIHRERRLAALMAQPEAGRA